MIINRHWRNAFRNSGHLSLFIQHSLYSGAAKKDEFFRINRCLPALSRRQADSVIHSGRVKVNGVTAGVGTKVNSEDIITLDGVEQAWRTLLVSTGLPSTNNNNVFFSDEAEIVKMWKPEGITCTCDLSDPTNIITFGNFGVADIRQRLFPIGRLDKGSTGIILLTSSGTLMHHLTRPDRNRDTEKGLLSKTYVVTLDKRASDVDLARLREGIHITTVVKRETFSKTLFHPTMPCIVKRHHNCSKYVPSMVLSVYAPWV